VWPSGLRQTDADRRPCIASIDDCKIAARREAGLNSR
jgi:hypothetical protein